MIDGTLHSAMLSQRGLSHKKIPPPIATGGGTRTFVALLSRRWLVLPPQPVNAVSSPKVTSYRIDLVRIVAWYRLLLSRGSKPTFSRRLRLTRSRPSRTRLSCTRRATNGIVKWSVGASPVGVPERSHVTVGPPTWPSNAAVVMADAGCRVRGESAAVRCRATAAAPTAARQGRSHHCRRHQRQRHHCSQHSCF